MNTRFDLPLLLDGATGTNLMKAGLPSGVCTEKWILDNPRAIAELQRAYASAGSGAVMAPTFETNRFKLSNFGFEDKVKEFNTKLVGLSRSAVGDGVLVAGDISPTGLFVEPFGETTFDELTDIYREQAFALRDAGVDYIAIETMMSLTESRAALLAAKETGLPVTVSVTVNPNGRTLSGGDVSACLVTLAAMGASAVGINCSTGPQIVLTALKAAAPYLNLPLIAKPNAGLPREDRPGEYDITPTEFADYLPAFLDLGVRLIGGCCGTTPGHIALLKEKLNTIRLENTTAGAALNEKEGLLAADERKVYRIKTEDLKNIQEIECDEDFALNIAEADDGPVRVCIRNDDCLDEFVQSSYLATAPILLKSDDDGLLEGALKIYQGRALVDPECGIARDRLETLSGRYGAAIL